MEISRTPISSPMASTDKAESSRARQVADSSPAQLPSTPALALESLQAALHALPEVDMQRVESLRQALAEGRLDNSPEQLAAGMLDYHRGPLR